eukprot:5102-Heterococcus_DN1.PRE.2
MHSLPLTARFASELNEQQLLSASCQDMLAMQCVRALNNEHSLCCPDFHSYTSERWHDSRCSFFKVVGVLDLTGLPLSNVLWVVNHRRTPLALVLLAPVVYQQHLARLALAFAALTLLLLVAS